MTITHHQTVRLSAGRHRCPEDGMCVMELSSVLSGGAFSDDPDEVCPVLAAFFRGYNDQLPESHRQAVLLRWAADAVGTRSEDALVTSRRAAAIERFARDQLEWWRPRGAYRGRELWRLEYLGGRIGQWAGRRAHRHAAVDELLERCVAAGAPPVAARPLSARAVRAAARTPA